MPDIQDNIDLLGEKVVKEFSIEEAFQRFDKRYGDSVAGGTTHLDKATAAACNGGVKKTGEDEDDELDEDDDVDEGLFACLVLRLGGMRVQISRTV